MQETGVSRGSVLLTPDSCLLSPPGEGAMSDRILVLATVVLAVADGLLHLTLDIVLFRGRFFLNELSILFLLNFVGYLVLAGVFLFSGRLLGSRAWLVNLLLGAYALAGIVMW